MTALVDPLSDPVEALTFGPLEPVEAPTGPVETPTLAPLPARDPIFSEHFSRVKSAVLSGHTLGSVPRWIVENTKIKGEQFSFRDHEFQLKILEDQSRELWVRKCAQVGISELSIRSTLAFLRILTETTAIYTLPTADFAKTFAATRVNPVIKGSPELRRALNTANDNLQVKQLDDSFLYIKGTVGQAAAISVPADMLVHDELDFSDPTVVSTYESRLQHSQWKIKRYFSTPTVEGYGVSAGFANSRRHWNFVKCSHCNHQFLPSYDDHVRIPGFTLDSLREIKKENLHEHRYLEAYVECPNCGEAPSLQPEYREWVVENPSENFAAAGYQIQPFDAPNIITCGDLIKSSTTYKRRTDFVNFALGLSSEDSETMLSTAELEACFIRGETSTLLTHVMGIDMGMICHISIGAVGHRGEIVVVHTEAVPLPRLKLRKVELCAQYRVRLVVQDAQPYTDTLLAMQETDPNLYGAVYVRSKNLIAYAMKKEAEKTGDEEDDAEAQARVRQVNINRNFAFDELMGFIRAGNWLIVEDQNKVTIIKHLQDMKRVREFGSDDKLAFVWQKSASGEDHFHHSFLYLYIAAQMRGASQSVLILPGGLVRSFKVTNSA